MRNKFEYRSTKLETNPNIKILMFQTVLDLGTLNFDIVLNFGFRASNFKFYAFTGNFQTIFVTITKFRMVDATIPRKAAKM